jgi:hypothetical protein
MTNNGDNRKCERVVNHMARGNIMAGENADVRSLELGRMQNGGQMGKTCSLLLREEKHH